MAPLDTLTRHLEHLCAVTGATSVSVYAPVPWASATPLLAHAGAAPPLAELASVEAAAALDDATGPPTADSRGDGSGSTRVSANGDGVLVRVPLLKNLWSAAPPAGQPHGADRRQANASDEAPFCGWIGLRVGPAATGFDVVKAASPIANALASVIVGLHGTLTDPLTGLPGRHELDVLLQADLQRSRRHGLPVGLVLVNPLGLDEINTAQGRRTGDAVLREVVRALAVLVRRTDAVMRYGGAIFALPLGGISEAHAVVVAERVRASIANRTFLKEAIRLRCAVGAVVCEARDADSVEPIDLLRRATEALGRAQESGGERVVLWQEATGAPARSPDRLFGIFTGRADKDYRNMGLLWDVLQVLSGARGTPDLARLVVERLALLLRCQRAGLFISEAGGPRLVAGVERRGGAPASPRDDDAVGDDERALAAAAIAHGEVRERLMPSGDGHLRAVAVPLLAGDTALGAIGLVGSPDAIELDRTDLVVLAGVAAQLAVALDRERLAERHRANADQERRRLQAEVQDLRSALQHGRLVFRSPVMERLLDRARRVAATDTTVLVTGESGTGKERLAQMLHRLSPRRTRPFVIVDCGAIPATLIDSELFGHERGAFTGASERKMGRLAQADGGTVFLDEIGELPLDVQSRLLRFVQEKTISSVGGTTTRKVDVRIIAATNRHLEDDVRAGRFREDLFYRLNVVRLHVPPLRERPEDVRMLARHFARGHAAEQGRSIVGFSDEAERRLLEHPWPGNVRELQNTVLQAVVLAEREELGVDDLTLPPVSVEPAVGPPAITPAARAAGDADPLPSLAADGHTFEMAWTELREGLGLLVRDAAAARPRLSWPLGRWLATDLTLAVYASVGHAKLEAARRLGLPPTTFARHLQKAVAERQSAPALPSWSGVRDAIERVAAACEPDRTGLAHDAEALLLGIVAEMAPAPLSFAAALMDWSTPTMKRRFEERERAAPAGPSGATARVDRLVALRQVARGVDQADV